jgi:hypothetical protein
MSQLKKLKRDIRYTQNDFQKKFEENDEKINRQKEFGYKKKFIVKDDVFNKMFKQETEEDREYVDYNKVKSIDKFVDTETPLIPSNSEARRIYSNSEGRSFYNSETSSNPNKTETGSLSNKNYNNSTDMTEDLGVDIKNLVFDILKMLADRKNPLPFIMNDERKQFSFAILLCISGGLMLFFSNLMRE